MSDLHFTTDRLVIQDVDAIVHPWSRNLLPSWLTFRKGIAKEIASCGGDQPFRELACAGSLEEGEAFVTSAGRLPMRGIVHVAVLGIFGSLLEDAIGEATQNAIKAAEEHGFMSLAFPCFGEAGGEAAKKRSVEVMLTAIKELQPIIAITIVGYELKRSSGESAKPKNSKRTSAISEEIRRASSGERRPTSSERRRPKRTDQSPSSDEFPIDEYVPRKKGRYEP
ncbi:RNase III inhibitor [Planctomycetes bacterium Pan216]|uniref:RNase III inhibitor n=1 Tax=Kolteria novifilia TaxID=2527975 RepID=A0A518B2G0_9BACT|nr:RNase III inhibitor [Planctomycetes bacterium Pan216]